jgi:hypothetical protein
MTREEALEVLAGSDHAILTVEAATEIAIGLGIPREYVPAQEITDNRSELKGARLYGKKEGESAAGVDATELAMALCRGMNIPFRVFFGRGSQLRECVAALTKHFSAKK